MESAASDPWDYVIVGSGAGGGTLAARLAEAGMRVFLLEAGGDPLETSASRLPDDYRVPGFHAFAGENAAMSRNVRVRHYADEARQARDPKYDAAQGGVLYPRAAALGGCTAHNAMIFMLPHEADWDRIAEQTGDPSWRARRMRRYARKVEACRYRPLWRALHYLGINPTGHGWSGWLNTERSIPLESLGDRDMQATVKTTTWAFIRSLRHPLLGVLRWLPGQGDPNARPWGRRNFEGLCYTPLSTDGHRRVGTRERLLGLKPTDAARLHVELDALATRILFDASGAACGVEYLKGRHLYRAASGPDAASGERREVRAQREVILCGGAFNTPQLLMLSGVGPADTLRRHQLPVRVDLPGVGRNLQDRYEVAVTHRLTTPWRILEGARFERGDPLWTLWNAADDSMYDSNGAAIGVIRRSRPELPEPDLFCMALPTRFEGYFAGYAELMREHLDYLTWAVLKAHTLNRAGTVTLKSANARDEPVVNFRYFEEGDDPAGKDLDAVVEGVRFVRQLAAPLIDAGVIAEECSPGPAVESRDAIADYVRNAAWGHHAACSCPIGTVAEGGVVNSAFQVHGVPRLRVVDASVFPRIPGFFLVSAVYMIAEKAADVILADAA